MKRSIAVSVVVACLTLAMGCAKSPQAVQGDNGADAAITPCEEPRPEVCTMIYDPVCGATISGESKTYSNACTACSDRTITGYRIGACAADGSVDRP